jgi:hypothetical protein
MPKFKRTSPFSPWMMLLGQRALRLSYGLVSTLSCLAAHIAAGLGAAAAALDMAAWTLESKAAQSGKSSDVSAFFKSSLHDKPKVLPGRGIGAMPSDPMTQKPGSRDFSPRSNN